MLSKIFEKIYVINLARRQDRFEKFQRKLPVGWPFQTPERFEAVDGSIVPPPYWWKSGNGAWGCYISHLRVIEQCLNQNIESVLVFEDDAVFANEFTEKVELFFDHLPDDWNYVYLGGQHLQEDERLPRNVNEWVYQPYNVNRTHAYAFRGRGVMEQVYRHLLDFSSWRPQHHIDHHLGKLHKRIESGLYVPHEWLVAQGEGESDISGQKHEYRIFPGAESLVFPEINRAGIAILGGYFGGAELIEDVLLALEPSLNRENDEFLPKYCGNCYAEQWLTEKLPLEDRTNLLRRWAALQCKTSPISQFFWGQHPLLSLMGPELQTAWNDPYFIVIERESNDSFLEMNRGKERWNPETFYRADILLKQARTKFVSTGVPKVIRISFNDLLEYPETHLKNLYDFLKIAPSTTRVHSGVELVRFSREKYRKD